MNHFRELCRLRSTLECFAAVRLTDHPERSEIIGKLRLRLDELQRKANRGDYAGFHQVDITFHREIILSRPVPTLAESWERVMTQLDLDILQVQQRHWPSLMALYREHEYLMEAWCSQDTVAIEQATHHHLEVGLYRMKEAEGRLTEIGSAVDRVASFLSAHYASEIDMAWIAKHVAFLSQRHLTRRFGESMGLAPYAWLRRLRMEKAAQLLQASELTTAEIGRRVGYKNASHFSRDFQAAYAQSPKNYRMQ